MLADEEASCLKALATEEEQKLSAVQQLIESTNSDIIALKQLIESVKREMGNEDLGLLQVKNSETCNFKVVFFLDFRNLANLKMSCFYVFQNFCKLKRK